MKIFLNNVSNSSINVNSNKPTHSTNLIFKFIAFIVFLVQILFQVIKISTIITIITSINLIQIISRYSIVLIDLVLIYSFYSIAFYLSISYNFISTTTIQIDTKPIINSILSNFQHSFFFKIFFYITRTFLDFKIFKLYDLCNHFLDMEQC